MTGSLLQLVAVGNEDIFITGNPQITFFKAIYKRFSNFSMENIDVVFANLDKRLSYDNPIRLYATIPKDADLISNIFLKLNLPEITTSNTNNIRWIRDIGTAIINYVKIFIGGQLIEELKGDYITAYYKTTLNNSKLETFNDMVGNIPELYSPEVSDIENTINDRTLFIPLPFWFSKHIGVALPICAITNQEIRLEIELKPIKELYIKLDNFTLKNRESDIENWKLDPILDVNYIFVDDNEKQGLKSKAYNSLIEIINYREFIGKSGSVNLQVEMFHPTKDIIILARRDDVRTRNQHTNYTNLDSMDNDWLYRPNPVNINNYKFFTDSIINSIEIKFNGDIRLSERTYDYFNKIQPYMHYKNTFPGLNIYSFSINPDKYQPSGACNFTEIRKIELILNMKSPKLYESLSYDYDVMVFTSTYNIFKIEDGLCKLVYNM